LTILTFRALPSRRVWQGGIKHGSEVIVYSGMIINNLISAVERAERRVAAAREAEEMAIIEIPAALLANISYADELVVA
jgi:hypothetical protein